MVVLARPALAGALLASVSVASPVAKELSKKDVDTRYPYNGPTVVIGMSGSASKALLYILFCPLHLLIPISRLG